MNDHPSHEEIMDRVAKSLEETAELLRDLTVHRPNVHRPNVHRPNVHRPNVHRPNVHRPNRYFYACDIRVKGVHGVTMDQFSGEFEIRDGCLSPYQTAQALVNDILQKEYEVIMQSTLNDRPLTPSDLFPVFTALNRL